MEFLAIAFAGVLGNICSILSLSTTSTGWFNSLCSPGDISSVLGPHLSSGAHIYLPGSDQFTQATTRWSAYQAPNFTVIVKVATESDVGETVKYANKQNIPFIAVNGGHGAIRSLEDGKTATIGGGALSKQITDSLWTKGKQTVTGICECTSLLGPGLGGGHGILQGRYGLIADQFVSLNVVLANGSLITVGEESDLWWGLKGAGHNFGIITSATTKIYDVPDDGVWSYIRFIYTHDKVEDLYEAINTHLLKNGTQPVDFFSYSLFFNLPSLDPDHSLIAFFILQGGTASVESQYADPFKKMGPVMMKGDHGSFKDIAKWTDMATDSPPSLNNSFFLFEGYSVQGVQSIPSDSTAFPHREANLLVAPVVTYEPGDKKLESEAFQFGETLREIIFQGSDEKEMYSYVNYASGNEGPQSWYGYEPWRLEKLRVLKEKYDPDNRLSFYAPFV
ncbi:FAD binding domain-containing protein [Penicillium cinerascens]|uniref:FAD binding domain-containing protein n=1 Tax=Penicillium cinerascens TaxID=70096 RepID=A0A9W9T7U0_9EURO|nr:FAD binding domain-containing protein [Penicillium cinerascens]KAJ5211730.1 FAD binding domain-containing protein [Penicillium cinerascens]